MATRRGSHPNQFLFGPRCSEKQLSLLPPHVVSPTASFVFPKQVNTTSNYEWTLLWKDSSSGSSSSNNNTNRGDTQNRAQTFHSVPSLRRRPLPLHLHSVPHRKARRMDLLSLSLWSLLAYRCRSQVHRSRRRPVHRKGFWRCRCFSCCCWCCWCCRRLVHQ